MSFSWLAGSPFASEIQIMWEILKGLKTRLVTINQFNFVSVCKLKTIPHSLPAPSNLMIVTCQYEDLIALKLARIC